MDHTVKAFDEDLGSLAQDVARLGLLATGEIADAIVALVNRDATLAQAVVDRDRKLDTLELEIEERAVRLVALRQPVAIDLRRALAAMKMAANLERCGDLAKNVAKRTLAIGDIAPPASLIAPIEQMGRLVLDRLETALAAYATDDLIRVREVWTRDGEVDAAYEGVFRALLADMMGDPRLISSGAHLLFVAKNLERIGDHATNIAEVVHYAITGEQLTERPKLAAGA
jgi:phosphate transport system protein